MKNKSTFSTLLFFLCMHCLKSQTDKQIINKIDSLEQKILSIGQQISQLPKKIEDEINAANTPKKSNKDLEKANKELKANQQKNKELNDSIKILYDNLVVARNDYKRLADSLAGKNGIKLENEQLKKQVEEQKKQGEEQVKQAAQNATQEEKKRAQKQTEALVVKLIASSAIVDVAVIDTLAAGLTATHPLQVKISTFKQQSRILHDAIMFLEEGKGKFNDVYEALIKSDFNSGTYAEQFKLQQTVKKRYEIFLGFATEIAYQLDQIKEITPPKLREIAINNPEAFSPLILEAYPYLLAKIEANKLKPVSLDIDAKYLKL